MGTFFCLIFCLLPVLVLANNDTDMHYTNTTLFSEEDDHDYELLQEVDTDTSGDDIYFEDMILTRLQTIDETYV